MTWLLRNCMSPGSSAIVKDSSSATAARRSSASSCAGVSRGTSGRRWGASTKVREEVGTAIQDRVVDGDGAGDPAEAARPRPPDAEEPDHVGPVGVEAQGPTG